MAASVGQAAATRARIVGTDVPDGHAVTVEFIERTGQFVRSLFCALISGKVLLKAALIDLDAEFQEIGLGGRMAFEQPFRNGIGVLRDGVYAPAVFVECLDLVDAVVDAAEHGLGAGFVHGVLGVDPHFVEAVEDVLAVIS